MHWPVPTFLTGVGARWGISSDAPQTTAARLRSDSQLMQSPRPWGNISPAGDGAAGVRTAVHVAVFMYTA